MIAPCLTVLATCTLPAIVGSQERATGAEAKLVQALQNAHTHLLTREETSRLCDLTNKISLQRMRHLKEKVWSLRENWTPEQVRNHCIAVWEILLAVPRDAFLGEDHLRSLTSAIGQSAMSDPDDVRKLLEGVKLSRVGDPKRTARAILAFDDPTFREWAIENLIDISETDGFNLLLEFMADEGSRVRRVITHGLYFSFLKKLETTFGGNLGGVLLLLARDRDPEVRKTAVRILATWESAEGPRVLQRLLDHVEGREKEDVLCHLLGARGADQAFVTSLIEERSLLAHPSRTVRFEAITALSDSTSLSPALEEAVWRECTVDGDFASHAARVLYRVGSDRLLGRMLTRFKVSRWREIIAKRGVVVLGDFVLALSASARALKVTDPRVASYVKFVLDALKFDEAELDIDSLVEALPSPYRTIILPEAARFCKRDGSETGRASGNKLHTRLAMIKAIGEVLEGSTMPHEDLDDLSAYLGGILKRTLSGRKVGEDALKRLLSSLADDDPFERQKAQERLEQIAPMCMPRLQRARQQTSDVDVREAISQIVEATRREIAMVTRLLVAAVRAYAVETGKEEHEVLSKIGFATEEEGVNASIAFQRALIERRLVAKWDWAVGRWRVSKPQEK